MTSPRTLGRALAPAWLGLLLAGCSSPAEPSRPDSETAVGAAVHVEAEGCGLRGSFGMGTVIGDEGLAVTAAHVVAGASTVTVAGADGSTTSARLVAIDRDLDLALLDTTLDTTPLHLGRLTAEQTGMFAVLRDGEWQALTFEVLRLVDVRIDDIDHDDTVVRAGAEVEAAAVIGDSGTALVADGQVVAILFAVSRGTPGNAWVTDVELLRPMVEAVAADGGADGAPTVDSGECS